MSKLCLVTGGAGFIGHHLVKKILDTTDWDVIVMDNLSESRMGLYRLRDTGCFPNDRVRVFTHDLSLPIHPGLQRELRGVTFIAHLAAESHVEYSYQRPGTFISSNVNGTLNILEFSRTLQYLNAFLYFSTDEVFGPSNPGQVFDEYSRHNPANPYAATKSAAEALATAWENSYGLPVVISHCCNAYGERQGAEKFIPKILHSLYSHTPLTIHVDVHGVSGSRMYVYVGDVACAIIFLLLAGIRGTKYNIPGEEVSNENMVSKLSEITNKTILTTKNTPDIERPGWDFRYSIKGERLHAAGWRPIVLLDEGLSRVAEWYKGNL
jgi:dTDP-glucose 4,6-dehydratase